MSFTAKPQFTGLSGNAAQSQQQNQSGQSKPHADVPLQNFPSVGPTQNQQSGNPGAGAHAVSSLTSLNIQQLIEQTQQYTNLQQTLRLQQQQQQFLQLQQLHQQTQSAQQGLGSEPSSGRPKFSNCKLFCLPVYLFKPILLFFQYCPEP